jgi:hypothetical protein
MYRAQALLFLLASSVILAGCGRGDGLTRYRVQGTVTFRGEPVKDGGISFEPTASVGEIAPTSYLKVTGGKYDALDQGPVAGKYRVIVFGKDTAASHVDSDGVTHTEPLFEEYKFEVDIPPPNNTLNVEVPASQALKKR